MLQLNDEALNQLVENSLTGKVVFGLQEDFSDVLLPQLLGVFSRSHPNLQLQSIVGRHQELMDGIQSGELDFSLGWRGIWLSKTFVTKLRRTKSRYRAWR